MPHQRALPLHAGAGGRCSDADLEQIARLGGAARKTGARDLPLVLARGGNGATTVSGTMWLARMAGIRVFVTGGIGGVHRCRPPALSPSSAPHPSSEACTGAAPARAPSSARRRRGGARDERGRRGAEESWDVSADLTELARTPVTVVCAGVKSILDIPRTLEFLETHSVAALAFKADAFPAFFTADSGCPPQAPPARSPPRTLCPG